MQVKAVVATSSTTAPNQAGEQGAAKATADLGRPRLGVEVPKPDLVRASPQTPAFRVRKAPSPVLAFFVHTTAAYAPAARGPPQVVVPVTRELLHGARAVAAEAPVVAAADQVLAPPSVPTTEVVPRRDLSPLSFRAVLLDGPVKTDEEENGQSEKKKESLEPHVQKLVERLCQEVERRELKVAATVVGQKIAFRQPVVGLQRLDEDCAIKEALEKLRESLKEILER